MRYRFLPVLFCLLSLSSFAQQWPRTLLWRISGNGLAKPSYLYGTMHLRDKRLFNFGDSLYQALESVDGLALEVNFQDFMDSVFSRQIKDEIHKAVEETRVAPAKKLDRSADSLLKKFNLREDRLTRADLRKVREYRMQQLVVKEMPTIVDGYLYGMALRQGKWTGGIEDVSDQLEPLDETGSALTPDKVFLPADSLRRSFMQLLKAYETQDLQGLANLLENNGRNELKDPVLVRRNVKMARRMDSLAALRTMFFAVGAAHLPGDSGVVNLLRSRGFRVDPVFSAKRTPAEVYARKLEKAAWAHVEDEEKLYAVEMPGPPSDYNFFGQMVKMKMFFDLTTMTFYMTGQSIGRLTTLAEAQKLFRRIAENMAAPGVPITTKPVTQGNAKGLEGSFGNKDGEYRLRLLQRGNTFFMLMVGAEKKQSINTADAERFFSSFVALDPAAQRTWASFAPEGKGFHISMPGEPRPNTDIDRMAENTLWTFHTYDFVDNSKGLYYMVQVRDINEGYYLNGDSNFFNIYVKDFTQRVNKVVREERGRYKGFACLYFDGIWEKENTLYRTFHVIRGNRVYSFVMAGAPGADFSDAPTFFQSLVLDPYAPPAWKTYGIAGFRTSVPAPFHRKGGMPDLVKYHVAYDDQDAVSYQVFKRGFPALYWSANDSIFLEQQAAGAVSRQDTVLSKRFTRNGSLPAVEILVASPDQSNLKKVRMILNGDSLYLLLAYIPRQDSGRAAYSRFFDDFRAETERAPTIFTDRSAALLAALAMPSDSVFGNARDVFSTMTFGRNDISFLRHALLHSYMDSTDNYGMSYKIAEELRALNDTAVVDFLEQHYAELQGSNTVRFNAARLLAELHTPRSYGLLRRLLSTNPPAVSNTWMLQAPLADSLTLTRTLFPAGLVLLSDTNYYRITLTVIDQLVNAGMLTAEDLLPSTQILLKKAEEELKRDDEDGDGRESQRALVHLLALLQGSAVDALLENYAATAAPASRLDAVLALLRRGKPVDPKYLAVIAADRSVRSPLYRNLKSMGRLALFPAKYATQQSLAESDVCAVALEMNRVPEMSFIGEKVIEYEGRKQKFYLYKLVFNDTESGETHLGIAGPYALKDGAVVSPAASVGIYWTEEYSAAQTGSQLLKYLGE